MVVGEGGRSSGVLLYINVCGMRSPTNPQHSSVAPHFKSIDCVVYCFWTATTMIAYMNEREIQTHLSKGDADVLIVQTAVDYAMPVTTVLYGRYRSPSADVLACWLQLMWPDLQIRKKEHACCEFGTDDAWIQNALGPQIGNLLPFAHVIAGCDTTSRLFGIGKVVALRVWCKIHERS